MNTSRLPLWAELVLLGLLALLLLPAMVLLRLWTAVLAVAFLIVVSLDRVLPRVRNGRSLTLLGHIPMAYQIVGGTIIAMAIGVGIAVAGPSARNVALAVSIVLVALVWMALSIAREVHSRDR